MAMLAVAIDTRPKSAGTKMRARNIILNNPIDRSSSLNSTIHAAPLAILVCSELKRIPLLPCGFI
jgi:hypothetical protein